jgi:Pyridoxamine 5'-phosphate oxidase
MQISHRNLDGYGAPPIDWTRVRDTLARDLTQAPGTGGPDRHTAWLTTLNPDGSPHLTPVGIIQIDGVWYFSSGPRTRKSRNIAADARCTISVATAEFDLVLEAAAKRVTDGSELRSVAASFVRTGWPAEVQDGALTADYSAPSAGPPPWYVYRITPRTVYAFGTAEPFGATRFEVSEDR